MFSRNRKGGGQEDRPSKDRKKQNLAGADLEGSRPEKRRKGRMKGCGCGCLIVILLVVLIGGAFIAAPQVTYSTLVAKFGDEVMTMPPAAAKTGLTFNQLLADREAAKKERGAAYKSSCDLAFNAVFYGGWYSWYIMAKAAMDPAGRDGDWGKKISSHDWDRGYVPVDDTVFDRAMFDSMVAIYWHMAVLGAPVSDHNCGLRVPKPANGGADL